MPQVTGDVAHVQDFQPRPERRTAPSRESVATIVADECDDAAQLVARVRAAVPGGMTPLALFIFGRGASLAEVGPLIAQQTNRDPWPMLVIEGRPCHAGAFAGAQVFFAPSRSVRRITVDGCVLGSIFDDGEARYCVLAGVGPRDVARNPAAQARETFENLASVLKAAGFQMRDLVRTWFYNRRLLDWYGEFNRVRAAAYAGVEFRLGAYPASTGIEGNSRSGAALEMAAWATQPRSCAAREAVAAVDSPLQCPAPRYGSLFSRAAAMCSNERARLFVSGTASIAPGGESIWPGDAARQIDQTMRVVETILATRGMTLADVDRATAYFKRGADLPHFAAWLRARGLDGFPFVPMQCDVCRDDLLFELEADAVLVRDPIMETV